MTVQARVVGEPWCDGVAVYLMRESMGTRIIERHNGGVPSGDIVERGTDPGPSLRLDDQMARALLDALAQHYGGAGDARTQRQDYDAERRRVDRLIQALIDAHAATLTTGLRNDR